MAKIFILFSLFIIPFLAQCRGGEPPLPFLSPGGVPPLPYCAPALGRPDAEKQRKYGRPDTGPKTVWPSGHRTSLVQRELSANAD